MPAAKNTLDRDLRTALLAFDRLMKHVKVELGPVFKQLDRTEVHTWPKTKRDAFVLRTFKELSEDVVDIFDTVIKHPAKLRKGSVQQAVDAVKARAELILAKYPPVPRARKPKRR